MEIYACNTLYTYTYTRVISILLSPINVLSKRLNVSRYVSNNSKIYTFYMNEIFQNRVIHYR